MAAPFQHNYSFDPSYGYSTKTLLAAAPGNPPADFAEFWTRKYQQALDTTPRLSLQDTGEVFNHWRILDCYYHTTDHIQIGGWLLLPAHGNINNALVWAHGYGGLEAPDPSWNLQNTAILFPCSRGIGRSRKSPISSQPEWHVLHNIQDKQRYIIGGCVQDIWCGISALLTLFPQVSDHIGLIGSSFGAGLGVFASAFDPRITRSHFHVPTFGNPEIRMTLPTVGSTHSLRQFALTHPDIVAETLPYFDASCAARYLNHPSYWALALFDPFVAPPGQFSIYNACPGDKQLYLLEAGHFSYPDEHRQLRELRQLVEKFFTKSGAGHAA
ncbi:deacetylase [Vibrio albus]|uniref:Deacetylase n=1 Tax=Vibrio albus TaxID=2200953 RepID=A0A2U3B7B0_9VIBR|nr:acetylxylan esterase [Vibrio albus]PWI32614.1 deacetylase [Vibrio albus]